MPLPKLNLTAPPPNVVLLPDEQFFIRALTLATEAGAMDVRAQVELALESLAPFALSQMYYGYFMRPGAAQVLLFAAYRKRFTAEQTALWSEADAVLPTFAAILGVKAGPATTLVLRNGNALTAVHWADASGVPSSVCTLTVPDEADEAARTTAKEALLRQFEGTRTYLELDTPPVFHAEKSSDGLACVAGKETCLYPRESLDVMDVRDKDELAQRRRARGRDLLLWRCFMGAAAALVLCGTLELGIIGGRFWQDGRKKIVEKRTAEVGEINAANTLATRIEELSTKRLRYFEMVTLVDSKRPDSTYFTSVSSGGLNKLVIMGKTPQAADLPGFQSALKAVTGLRVEVVSDNSRNGVRDFTLEVEFTPEALNGGQS